MGSLDDIGRSLVELVKQCLCNDPHKRPKTSELHAFMKKLEREVQEKTQNTQNEVSQDLYDKYLKDILASRESIEMWLVKVIFIGAPCLGKTTLRRRLAKEIHDISSSGEKVQPSTGVVETGHSIVIRSLSSTTAIVTQSEWLIPDSLSEEGKMVLEFFYSHKEQKDVVEIEQGEAMAGNKTIDANLKSSVEPEIVVSDSMKVVEPEYRVVPEITQFIFKQIKPTHWREIKHLFRDTTFLRMEDTGGQPEFMDMLPALTIGPALYLLFCKLTDNLHNPYTVSYRSPSGESTAPVQSTYTGEEVLLRALSSISSLSNLQTISADAKQEELAASCSNSVAYIIGTHKDLVSEKKIEKFDEKLQRSIRSTDFFEKGLVHFFSEKRMILPIDNMNGGEREIDKLRSFLEQGIRSNFSKIKIPAAWLVLSLCLRKKEEKLATLESVLELAGELNIPEEESKVALWFLHYHAGVLMYFPNLPKLKHTVICDTQIVYDSASHLIINTFKFGEVGKAASERFKETGQFSLEDIRGITAKVSGDYIPLQELIELLQYLNIIASIDERAYFMPCVLPNATHKELNKRWKANSSPVAPIFVQYETGYVPTGVFPAMIANLAGQESHQLITEGIAKNKVQFLMSQDLNTVSFISKPKYFSIHIKPPRKSKTAMSGVCGEVISLVKSTLDVVTSRMSYQFRAKYQLAFECPAHNDRDHLCAVMSGETSPQFMCCKKSKKKPLSVKMHKKHLVWFEKQQDCSLESTPQRQKQQKAFSKASFHDYVLSMPVAARPHLEQKLDWGHEGVEKDLMEIAHHMVDWEASLSSHLGLTHVDVHDITEGSNNLELQRREVLRRWQRNSGLRATYGNLLELFVRADRADCAEILCDVLRRKYSSALTAKHK